MQLKLNDKKTQLLLGASISLLLIIAGIVISLSKPASSPAAATPQGQILKTSTEQVSTAAKVPEEPEEERKTKAFAAIEDHEAVISSGAHAEETPDRLVAIGNLYQYQINDYYSAIDNYRNYISKFPQHDKVPQAYLEIAQCYEKLDDNGQARQVYQEMVKALDPSLQHVRYAKQMLEKD